MERRYLHPKLNIRNTQQLTFICEHCPTQFLNKTALSKHVNAVHNITKLFSCNECNFSTSTQDKLSKHFSRMHDCSLPYDCNQCLLKFRNNPLLVKHMREDHNCVQTFSCNICSYNTVYAHNIKAHVMKVHHSNSSLSDYTVENRKYMDFKCEQCSSEFSSNTRLLKHIREEHNCDKPFSCNQCNYSTSKRHNLRQHVSGVHERLKSFACSQCSSKFTLKLTLMNHIRSIHDEVKPFQCDKCSYTSVTRYSIKQHIASVHYGILQYGCDLCSARFAVKQKMLRHKRSAHGVPFPAGQRKSRAVGRGKAKNDKLEAKASEALHSLDDHNQQALEDDVNSFSNKSDLDFDDNPDTDGNSESQDMKPLDVTVKIEPGIILPVKQENHFDLYRNDVMSDCISTGLNGDRSHIVGQESESNGNSKNTGVVLKPEPE